MARPSVNAGHQHLVDQIRSNDGSPFEPGASGTPTLAEVLAEGNETGENTIVTPMGTIDGTFDTGEFAITGIVGVDADGAEVVVGFGDSGSGGDLGLHAGNGNDGDGGAASLRGGTGTVAGGTLALSGGGGSGGDAGGGALTLYGGTTTAGGVLLVGGTTSVEDADGGPVEVHGGSSAAGSGYASLVLNGMAGGGSAGLVLLAAGAAGAASDGDGGDITLTPGAGDGAGRGGGLTVSAGEGGDGGDIAMTSGHGTDGVTGRGGDILLTTGNGNGGRDGELHLSTLYGALHIADARVSVDVAGVEALALHDGLVFLNLPTSDPATAGGLWSDNGRVTDGASGTPTLAEVLVAGNETGENTIVLPLGTIDGRSAVSNLIISGTDFDTETGGLGAYVKLGKGAAAGGAAELSGNDGDATHAGGDAHVVGGYGKFGDVPSASLRVKGGQANGDGGDIILTPGSAGAGRDGLVFLNLPTSDPGVAGALWADTGVVKVSAG